MTYATKERAAECFRMAENALEQADGDDVLIAAEDLEEIADFLACANGAAALCRHLRAPQRPRPQTEAASEGAPAMKTPRVPVRVTKGRGLRSVADAVSEACASAGAVSRRDLLAALALAGLLSGARDARDAPSYAGQAVLAADALLAALDGAGGRP